MDGWVCVMRIKLQLQGQGLELERILPWPFGRLIPVTGSTGTSDWALKVSSVGIFIIFPF